MQGQITLIDQFHAPAKAEIMGLGLLGICDNLAQEQLDPILTYLEVDPGRIEPESWYRLADYYQLLHTIFKTTNGPALLMAVGKALAHHLTDIAAVGNMENLVTDYFNFATSNLIRNTPSGFGYLVSRLGPQRYQIRNNTGTSNDVVFGYIWESMRLVADGRFFTVTPVSGFHRASMRGAVFNLIWE